jgi:hypothetical protein
MYEYWSPNSLGSIDRHRNGWYAFVVRHSNLSN